MSEAAPPRAATVPKKKNGGSKPRIPPKLLHALKLLSAGAENVETAAQQAGMSRSGLYAALEKVHVRAKLHELCERDIAVLGVPRAKAQIIASIDSASPYVALDASKTVLQHAGVLRSHDGGRGPAASGGVRITFISSAAQPGATAVQIDVDTAQTSSKSEG